MAENSAYFETIVAERSVLLSDEESLTGDITLSIETLEDHRPYDMALFSQEQPFKFLKLLQYLNPEDKDLLLQYFRLAVPQEIIGKWHGRTQTKVSYLIREALDMIGAFLLFGEPTQELLFDIFCDYGLEYLLEVPLSVLFMEFARTQSYEKVAKKYGVSRQELRRLCRNTANQLRSQTEDIRGRAVGAWVWKKVDGVAAVGVGKHAQFQEHFFHTYRRDPECLGKFRIDVTDPGFEAVFTPKANH